jgi:hypothetical protein
MKTQVIQLDRFDDAASVKDKMDWGQSERILLVWPGRRGGLGREMDLALIARHSQTIGAHIAVVSRDELVARAAEKRNIPVFRSVREAQRLPWASAAAGMHGDDGIQRPQRRYSLAALKELAASKRSNVQRPAPRAWFWAGVASALLVAGLFAPGAAVVIEPVRETQTMAITLTVDAQLARATLSGGMPAETLRVIVEGRDSLKPSGSVSIPQSPASGMATFTNLTDHAITIPAGTVVRTRSEPTARFATVEAATLPAEAGSSVNVRVEAENPGSASNLPAGSLTAIEGELSLSLAVTNSEATSGGTERVSGAPSELDYTQLEAALLDALWQSALAEARGLIGANDLIVNVEPGAYETLAQTFTPAEAQPANTLDLQMQVAFEVLFIRAETLEAALGAALDANNPAGLAGQPGSLVVTPQGDAAFGEDGTARWTMSAQRTLTSAIDRAQLPVQLAGQRRADAAAWLETTPGVETVTIHAFPPGWPWLPWFPFRIEVQTP